LLIVIRAEEEGETMMMGCWARFLRSAEVKMRRNSTRQADERTWCLTWHHVVKGHTALVHLVNVFFESF
jgi:hypothetical protein